jgi:hypothetical protein
VSNEKKAGYLRAYYLKNREKLLARQREYARTHQAQIKEQRRSPKAKASSVEYRLKRYEQIREAQKKWSDSHKDVIKARNAKFYKIYRAQKRDRRPQIDAMGLCRKCEREPRFNLRVTCYACYVKERDALTRRLYGMTRQGYWETLKAQHGTCRLCAAKKDRSTDEIFSKLLVDYDPEGQRVRGLLCHRCFHTVNTLGNDTVAALDYMIG